MQYLHIKGHNKSYQVSLSISGYKAVTATTAEAICVQTVPLKAQVNKVTPHT